MPVRFRIQPASPRAAERVVDVADPAPELRLGRRADLELPLPFTTLSSIHARVGHDGRSYWLQDAGSTNGTRLAGERLTPGERRPLAPGAEVHLADVCLRFEGAVPATTDGLSEPSEGTATIARRLVADLFENDVVPVLAISGGAPPRRLSLTDESHPYLVGRGETCALPLDVEAISREHAAFLRTATGVLVRDLGSKNGVLVNATRITDDHLLSDGDTIQIGPVTLTLEDPISRYLGELAARPEPPPAAPLASAPEAPSPSAPRPSSFSRLATTVGILVLALALTVALTLLR